MTEGPEAGWYPDPKDPNLARYWDGEAWTERIGPLKGPRRLHPILWAPYSVLAFSVLVNLFYVPVSLIYASKVQTQIDTGSLTLQQAEDAEHLFEIGGVVWIIALVAGAVGFLVWWTRAYANVPSLTGQSLRFGKGWAIGAWFVPILSLWRPKQIANDIWRGGDPKAKDNAEWASLPVSPLVHWWWAIYLLSSFVGGAAGGLLNADPVLSNSVTAPGLLPVADPPTHADLVQEHSAAIADATSGVLEIAAAVLAILFVRAVTNRQDDVIGPAEPTAGHDLESGA